MVIFIKRKTAQKNMQSSLTTARLLIEPLSLNDSDFIFRLLNTEGWIRFIGNKNIETKNDADAYIKKITENKNYSYLVVRSKQDKKDLGIVTFIKREYLPHHDIGFAFLPEFTGKGYAYEAAYAFLNDLLINNKFSHLLATTLPENVNSISLIKKLGLKYEKEIMEENETLHVYEVSADKLGINAVTKSFFSVFNNKNSNPPNVDLLRTLCIPEIRIIKKTKNEHTVYDLDSFMEPRKKLLTDGSLKEFEEHETEERTHIIDTIAQRHSVYEKSGVLEGKPFKQTGNKLLQFLKTNNEWRISSVIWEDEN